MNENTMTVKELIEILQEFPPDMPVLTEGCDCYGDAYSVDIIKDGDCSYVLIERKEERQLSIPR